MNKGDPVPIVTERAPNTTRTPSFGDQLLAPSLAHSDIPYEIRMDPSFLRQIESRKKLIYAYATYIENQKKLDSREKLCKELSNTFDTDTEFARAALYIPFSLLPDINSDEKQESKSFISSYKKAFISLLKHTDFRADFMDGDILEPELRGGKLPDQIVKAPHLLPWLMSRGIFLQEEVLSMIKTAQNPALVQALVDVIPVLYRDSLLNEDVFTVLKTSDHEAFRKLLSQIQEMETVPKKQPISELTPKELITSFSHAHQAMVTRITSASTSENRKVWQMEVQSGRLSDEFSYRLAPHIDTTLDSATLDTLLAQNDPPCVCLIINALRIKAGMEFETEGNVTEYTQQLIDQTLVKISHNENKEVSQALNKLSQYSHHYGVNIPSPEMPQFAQSEEVPRTKSYFESLTSCARFIEEDPTLSQYLYPVVVSLGSHAKGYAKEGSDTDMCVFVKAGIQETERETIHKKLEEMSSILGVHGSCMEFWIEESENGISFKNYENPDQHRGDSLLTHPFTGEWVGNLETTKHLRQGLMNMYIRNENKVLAEHPAREVWLQDIEHNMLQYRLMHKGYTSHVPPEKSKSDHDDFSIDGKSIFYDDGYRKVAFDIYLKKAFLPVVSSEEV